MAKSHTYHMFPFVDRPPPLLSGSDTCRPPIKLFPPQKIREKGGGKWV